MGYDAVVLAGGRSQRFGSDKLGLVVGGSTLVDRVVAAAAGAGRTVVVGPRRRLARPVVWVQERPAHAGPLAALAAGLQACRAPLCVVLAGDLPLVDRSLVEDLVTAACSARDGAVAADEAGVVQPLLACYRSDALRRALGELGDPRGRPVRDLLAALEVAVVRAGARARDVDIPADLKGLSAADG